MGYFGAQTAVQHHELALVMVHLVDRIARATKEGDGNAVLGACASALVLIDQSTRDEGSLHLACDCALMDDLELPYLGPEAAAAKSQRARWAKPYSPLCPPRTYAAVSAAFSNLEVLAKRPPGPKK